jgi:rhodanese-related sulfurtransferase
MRTTIIERTVSSRASTAGALDSQARPVCQETWPRRQFATICIHPDELVKYGSFATYLNLQLKDLPELLDYIPKDRTILTVSNRAHRAGAAGDILTAAGYKVAGATGSEDYREAGGTIVKVTPPAPAASAASK